MPFFTGIGTTRGVIGSLNWVYLPLLHFIGSAFDICSDVPALYPIPDISRRVYFVVIIRKWGGNIVFDIEQVFQPHSLAEALELLGRDKTLLPIAGGTDVLIRVREGKLAGARLLSIRSLPELSGIGLDAEGNLEIGALTTFETLENDSLIARSIPVLAHAAGSVGGPQIRAVGTIGGNICNGVTSADTASTIHALEAELVLSSIHGERRVAIGDFHIGPGKTSLQPGELLRKLIIRRTSFEGVGGCYFKYAMRTAMDIATLGCVVLVRPDHERQNIDRLRIAFGVAAPTVIRAVATENALYGMAYDAARMQIGQSVHTDIHPRDSWRASRDFRMHIAGELAQRALESAWEDALKRSV